jgi:hypothetical protein
MSKKLNILFVFIFFILLSVNSFAAVFQTKTILKDEVIASGGGFSESNIIDLSNSTGNISFFLENTGDSTDLSGTYEIGYVEEGDATNTYNWVTPEDGGLITTFTNVDATSAKKHASENLAVGSYKIKITNNDGVNDATVTLTIVIQNQS